MKNRCRIFKICLEAGAANFHVRMSELIGGRNLNDFLIDEARSPSTPQEFAARALSELCVGDRGSVDRAICSGVVQFLDKMCIPPPQDPDRRRRLVDVVKLIGDLQSIRGDALYQQFLRWANAWYS